MLWMIPYVLGYLFIGFVVMGIYMKIIGDTMENLKKDPEPVLAMIMVWPLCLIILAIFCLWIVLKWAGLWTFEHIFRIPSNNQPPIALAPPVPRPMYPADDPPEEKVISESTGNFEFMDVE